MKKLKEFLFLSDKGYKDLKKAIVACTITNLALMLPFCVTVMLFNELLNPYVGKQIAWNHIWLLWGIGVVSAVLVFLAMIIERHTLRLIKNQIKQDLILQSI